MQKMTSASLLTALCCISTGSALKSTIVAQREASGASLAASTLSQEWKACLTVEAEDANFWSSQWGDMESELLQLQAEAAGQPANSTKEPSRHFNPLAGLKLNLNPKSPTDLVPALAMLKGLYEDGKERIGKLNAREKKSKQQYEEKLSQHEQHLAKISARVQNGTLSKEFGTNETKDENRLWTYWEHVRERQHRQYHTSLKIQHSTLTKEKQMIDMYEKTIAGKESKKQLAKEFSKVAGGAPEVVLFQETRQAVVQFCASELAEVRSSRASLSQADSSALHASTFN